MLAGLKRYIRIVFVAAVSLAFLVFAIDNREVVHVSLFPFPFAADLPLFLLAILVFFLGALCGFFCSSTKAHRLNAQYKAESKQRQALQNQLDALHSERVAVSPVSSPALPKL